MRSTTNAWRDQRARVVVRADRAHAELVGPSGSGPSVIGASHSNVVEPNSQRESHPRLVRGRRERRRVVACERRAFDRRGRAVRVHVHRHRRGRLRQVPGVVLRDRREHVCAGREVGDLVEPPAAALGDDLGRAEQLTVVIDVHRRHPLGLAAEHHAALAQDGAAVGLRDRRPLRRGRVDRERV